MFYIHSVSAVFTYHQLDSRSFRCIHVASAVPMYHQLDPRSIIVTREASAGLTWHHLDTPSISCGPKYHQTDPRRIRWTYIRTVTSAVHTNNQLEPRVISWTHYISSVQRITSWAHVPPAKVMYHQLDPNHKLDPCGIIFTHKVLTEARSHQLDLCSISCTHISWIHAASAGSTQHQLDLYQLNQSSISWIYDASARPTKHHQYPRDIESKLLHLFAAMKIVPHVF
jgi:hypothetical protein